MENMEPKYPLKSGDLPYGALMALETAIKDGKLYVEEASTVSGHNRIAKGDFIAYCKKLGEVPPIYE